MGKALSEGVVETIDTEIKSLIIRINSLKIVEATRFSCAGYGEAGLGKRGVYEIPPDGSRGHVVKRAHGQYEGYVMLTYDPKAEFELYHSSLVSIANRFMFRNCPPFDYKSWTYTFTGSQGYLSNRWEAVSLATHVQMRLESHLAAVRIPAEGAQ